MTDRLNPDTRIPGAEGATVGGFWAWAYSDILANTMRGTLAEFLVGSAPGVIEGSVQSGWNDFDLEYGDHKIEVKSSAYLQSWHQDRPSKISFDIGERRRNRSRSADIYVFCVFADRERSTANLLDTKKWEFYVLSTGRIKSVVSPVSFCEIKETVDSALLPSV